MKNLPSDKGGLKMQKGFATLEIILAVMIIAVLTKSAVPNAVQLIDRAALDYETKRLYSELIFIQTTSKSSTILNTGTGNAENINNVEEKPNLTIETSKKSYQIFKDITNTKSIREPHYLSNGVTIKFRENATSIKISFDKTGKAEIYSNENSSNKETTLHLISRLKKEKRITFDSVGRIRGSLNDE